MLPRLESSTRKPGVFIRTRARNYGIEGEAPGSKTCRSADRRMQISVHTYCGLGACLAQQESTFAGCSKRPFSEAAASETARRTLRYVEPLSDARTMLADFFSTLLGSQLVAHASDSEEKCRTGRVLLDLLAQRMNVHIQRVLFERIALSPDPVEHLLAREHSAG